VGLNPPVVLGLEEVASGLASPLYVTAPAGDSRLFVVEQHGRIRIIKNGQLLPTPFLDITPQVGTENEQGLLSVAFHPSYATNGFFYIFYKDLDRVTRIERYSVSSDPDVADEGSSKLILAFPGPTPSHNGGLALFGPDGMLYIGTGDGGEVGDPQANGQNLGLLLGKILRIDVDHGDPYEIPADNPFVGRAEARGEIWAYGLRNPWRFSFDKRGGVLYIADVGNELFEEVNVVPSNASGINYGWNTMEGSSCFITPNCSRTGLQLPALVYDHSNGACSVIGGYVYRGAITNGLIGHYFYSDYCAGFLKSFRYQKGVATDQRTYDVGNIGLVTSFGEDSGGELYMTAANGRVYRIVRIG
jgi:glucose/arabinose dehydrogenase